MISLAPWLVVKLGNILNVCYKITDGIVKYPFEIKLVECISDYWIKLYSLPKRRQDIFV